MKYKVDAYDKEKFMLSSPLGEDTTLMLYIDLDTHTSTFTGSARIVSADETCPPITSVISGDYIPLQTMGSPTPIFSGIGYFLGTPLYDNLAFTFEVGNLNSGRFKYKAAMSDEWHVIEDANVA